MSENNHLSAATEQQTPKHLPSERELELMKRLQLLEHMFKDLKGQVEGQTAPSPNMPQIPEQNSRPSRISNTCDGGSKRAIESSTINQEEQSQVASKRRCLNYSKCTFCRKDKKTVSVAKSIWSFQT